MGQPIQRTWTIRERTFVERNYRTMESPQIAQYLGRTVVSVKRYINNNGWRKNKKRQTLDSTK